MNKTAAALIVGVLAGGGGLVAAWAVGSGPATPEASKPGAQARTAEGGAGWDDGSPAGDRGIGGDGRPMRVDPGAGDGESDRLARMLAEFDLDGDGELSREERDAARAAREAERLAKYDLDGDGRLSREERRNAWIDDMLESPRGRRLLDRFDTDGDGELSAEERLTMQDEWEVRRFEAEMAFTDRFDLDGDGELNDIERAAADDYIAAEREQMRADFTARFDADGNGDISRDERRAGFEQMRLWREQDQFTDRYDSDGDGSMGPFDTEAFLALIAAGDPAGDVNGDGLVDSSDVQAYQDMLSNLDPNRPDPVDPSVFLGGGRGGPGGGGPGGRGGG